MEPRRIDSTGFAYVLPPLTRKLCPSPGDGRTWVNGSLFEMLSWFLLPLGGVLAKKSILCYGWYQNTMTKLQEVENTCPT